MKSNNKLYIIIILSLFIFGLFLSNQFFDLRNDYNTVSKARPCEGSEESNSRIIASMESDNLSLDMETEIVSIEDKNVCYLKDIIHPDSMYLIFRVPLNYCGDCINDIFERLQVLEDSISCIRIIAIASGGTTREMKVKLLPFKDKFEIYQALLSGIGLPLDWSNIPYMVFTNNGKTSKHIFIIDSPSIELLNDYIILLSKKYCE